MKFSVSTYSFRNELTQFDCIANISKVDEIHALDRASFLDIEAGDYTFSDHFSISLSVIRFS